MNEPCRALMGYVPGRYVESTEPRPLPPVRRCRACGARMPDGCRNSGCSPECSEAILIRSRSRKRVEPAKPAPDPNEYDLTGLDWWKKR